MPKTSSSAPVKRPVMKKKVARKTVAKRGAKKAPAKKAPVKKPPAGKSPLKKPLASPEAKRRPRAKVLNEHPGNLVADPFDHAAIEAIGQAAAKTAGAGRVRRRTAVDMAADPPPGEDSAGSMVTRVTDAIERELTKIERIVGNPERMQPAQRIETESRARVLASLARTLKEVMRLRGEAEDTTKASDDDAIPRDLDEFRRELSRRLEGMVAGRAEISAGEHEPGGDGDDLLPLGHLRP